MNKLPETNVRYCRRSAWLQFNCKRTGNDFKMLTWAHRPLFLKCLHLLKKLGFAVGKDPYYEKMFPTLSQYHRYGKWRDLEVGIEIKWNGIWFEFYQNVNAKNPNGGKYDFDKYDLMPYLCQKRFEYTCQRLRDLIAKDVSVGYEAVERPVLAEEAMLRYYRESWHHHGVETLADVKASMKDYDHSRNAQDRDKKYIECGSIKYFRDSRTGRLMRGRVYWSLNSQWYVILHPRSYTCVSAGQLFDPSPEDFAQRRVKKGRIPEAKQQQLDLLRSLSPAMLRKALAVHQRKGVVA
ncbi:hypothetical protein LJ737_04375 [Hymenobacter sp. 15J16-1T3B]|uniref:hypothetical protein n=1 Tax=Hymenobacter sp. 15J16-1T3B TaxID=2886941 RepID=UPI001D101107|nr:hypothetical protein [Hymenobacter sp. 15J16-1T3B]MCC3156459.1 hypothetical protein [Hymenobacter sp. 15J16-1T3B]